MTMDYAQARRRARFMFGGGGDIRSRPGSLGPVYIVGVVQQGKFKQLGAGLSWEEAFNSVTEVVHGKGEGSGEEGDSAQQAEEGDGRVEGEASGAGSTDSSAGVHRVKL